MDVINLWRNGTSKHVLEKQENKKKHNFMNFPHPLRKQECQKAAPDSKLTESFAYFLSKGDPYPSSALASVPAD